MAKREELYQKLETIENDGDLIFACDTWIDSDEKIEGMLLAFDNGLLKTSDDVIEKILELEFGYDAVHGVKK